MTDLQVLQQSRSKRALREAQARRARRRRRVAYVLSVVVLGIVALLVFMAPALSGTKSGSGATKHSTGSPAKPGSAAHASPRTGYAVTAAPRGVDVKLKLPLRSGLLFEVHTGRVLWQREPEHVLPIASLTKMMTALVVTAHTKPSDLAVVTTAATHFTGSGVGLLPLGKKVQVGTLLYGLMLPSGNDAAIALAQYVAGNQTRFIAMMNAQAHEMGLRCTHFDTVSGIVDQGNYSCATDLAILAHAVLQRPLLARIVGSSSAILPFPIKGGKLYLYNNNPLLRMGYLGTDGVKTGYTVAAGQCLVATARRGPTWLGVVLLHSQDPPDQARQLLDAGFRVGGA